jgi:hypothetical protein
MPLVGEDYTMQAWGYKASPSSFVEKFNAVTHKVIYSAKLWNPRIGEALTTITAVFPKFFFDIINTLMFLWLLIVLFTIGFGRFPNWKRLTDSFAIFLIFFVIILFMPLLGQLFFWKSGACNHTWGLIILLSFILPYRLNYQRKIKIDNIFVLILFIIFGLTAGLTIENASVIVLVFLFLYFLIAWHQKKISLNFLYPIISFAIGVFILLFGPGTTVRRNYYKSLGYDGDFTGIAMYINRLGRIGKDFIKLSWPLLIIFFVSFLIYFFLKNKKKNYETEVQQNGVDKRHNLYEIAIPFFISISSVLGLISISYQSDQQRGFEFFWLISICLSAFMLTEIWQSISSRYIKILVIVCLIVVITFPMINLIKVYSQFHVEDANRKDIIFSALNNGDKEISLPAIQVNDSRLIETREILSDVGVRLASYYGFDSIEIQK